MINIEDVYFYSSHGLVVIPLAKNEKTPIIFKWDSKDADELKNFFLSKMKEGRGIDLNIGIRIEPPLFIIDLDDKRLASLILDEVPPTWIVETRRGIHVYLKTEDYYPKTNKRSRLIHLLAEKCQVVAPPSVVDGWRYRFKNDSHKNNIAILPKEKVVLLEKIVEIFAKYESLITKFAGVWNEGFRHNLSLWLNGYLRKVGVPLNEAAIIIKSICLLGEDPELRDRLRTLEDTYKKSLEQIRGISGLIEELSVIVGREKIESFLQVLPKPEHEGVDGEEKREERARKKKVSGPLVLEDAGVWIEPIEEGLLVIRGDGCEVYEEFEYGGVKYVKDGWIDGVVVLPPKPEEINSVEHNQRIS